MSGSTQPATQSRRATETRYPPHAMSYPIQLPRSHADIGLLEYQHHSRDYNSHLAHGSVLQPQRRRPSLLSEFQPGSERSQDLHGRSDPHSYLSDLSKQSEMEYMETKRPRLEMLHDQLMRHSPSMSQHLHGGNEDLAKDRSLSSKLEPVSPVSPARLDGDMDALPSRLSKEELIQNMDRVDREITMVEQQISKLKKKQQQLEEEAAKPPEPEKPISPPPTESKHRSLVQIIYDENRKKAQAAHRILEGLGPQVELPVPPVDKDLLMSSMRVHSRSCPLRLRLIREASDEPLLVDFLAPTTSGTMDSAASAGHSTFEVPAHFCSVDPSADPLID